ncbi:MAG: MFS transporter [Humibacillus sp.]|nr:MFS transporter [Humibacillus sp.]MDN5776663.1 MFS transporter [Humibacillus sp.]
MSPTFHSLSIRNYRIYASGAIVSNVGTWMGRVAQDWLVLTVLTDHSATALGLVTGLQFLPFLLLAPFAGMLVDRFPKRRILFMTQTALLTTALLLALLTAFGVVQLWHVFLLAFIQGLATAVDNPARQTFVSEMVDTPHLPNAVALNSASFNLGRLIGPAVAGLVIAGFGISEALFINAASFVFVLVALTQLNASELTPSPRARGKGQIREGLRYVKGRPDLKLILFLVFILGTFGMNFQVTMALMATQVFHKGAGEYGLLGSIMAVGSLTAALMSARRTPRMRVLIVALLGFTVSTGLLSLAPSYATFAIMLVPTGLAALTALTTANSIVQISVDPMMRGRVMALYMAIFMGGTPLGSPLIGWIGDAFGARWTIAIGTIMVGLSLVAVAVWVYRREDMAVSFELRRTPHLRVHTAAVGPATPEAVR